MPCDVNEAEIIQYIQQWQCGLRVQMSCDYVNVKHIIIKT